MGRLVRIAAEIERKRAQADAALRRTRRSIEREREAMRRSSPTARAIGRGVRDAQDALAGASASLAGALERQKSINRLIESTGERLARERAARERDVRKLVGDAAAFASQKAGLATRARKARKASRPAVRKPGKPAARRAAAPRKAPARKPAAPRKAAPGAGRRKAPARRRAPRA